MGISSIISIGKQVRSYGKRVLNATPELIFGTSAETAGAAMRKTQGSLFRKAEAGWHEIENAGKGSFFKNFLKNCKEFFPDIAKAYKSNGIKGVFKDGIGKKLPFIGAATMMLFEIPNVVKATKEQGIFQGLKEIVKSGAKLAGGGLGSAIGSAICPGIGGLVGWIAGEWITEKIVGKSYTEQKTEKEEIIAEYVQQNPQIQMQTAQNTAVNPYLFGNQTAFTGLDTNTAVTNPLNSYSIPYADDIMMQQLPFNMIG